jgi:hypothetical protein
MECWYYKFRVGKGRLRVGRGRLCWPISCGGNKDLNCVFQVGLYKWQILN